MASGAEAVVAAATEQLRSTVVEHLTAGGRPPVAVGISAPGPLDPVTGHLIDPPNLPPSLHAFPLGPRIGEAVSLPWALDRDTNVAVLAESRFGAGVGFGDLVYMTVSTGIGGGIITSGRLLTGPDRAAGELGHISVEMDGPVCGCGARGHLERLTSGTGIARSALLALEAGVDAPLLRAIAERESPRPLEAVHVDEAASAGDAVATDIIARALRAFAAAIVSIVNMFDSSSHTIKCHMSHGVLHTFPYRFPSSGICQRACQAQCCNGDNATHCHRASYISRASVMC